MSKLTAEGEADSSFVLSIRWNWPSQETDASMITFGVCENVAGVTKGRAWVSARVSK